MASTTPNGPSAERGVQARKPRRGDSLDLRVEELDARGRAFGRIGALVVRVSGAVPESRVRAVVRSRRRDEVEATLGEVLEPSPHAVEPRCAHFGTCGGCSYQHLSYAAQLEALGRALAGTLAPLARFAPQGRLALEPVVACEEPWGYRNKMDFTFGTRRWMDEPGTAVEDPGFALGLHVAGRFDRLVDVEHCAIAFPEASAILASARRVARELGLEAWDVRAHRGLLRHLVLRKGQASGEIMAYLVTSEQAAERVDPWAMRLRAQHPELTTLVHSVNGGVALVATGTERRVLFGPGTIDEVLDGVRFALSPESFFQTNTRQAERLIRLVRASAGLRPEDLLLDLYCGAGTFALCLARDAGEVLGLEVVESAVADARRNAVRNGVSNVRFERCDLAGPLAVPDELRPRVCVVDPPRAGLHPGVLRALRHARPERIVYVSCNPSRASSDLELLGVAYALERVQPIDLFPHTPHLECVFTLAAR